MLRAGAARVDITPTDLASTFLAGFGINRRPQGVLDRLEAVALFLDDGATSVALVAVDCIGFTRTFVEDVRERVTGFPDPHSVIVCATHTHSGPDTLGLWGSGPFGIFPTSTGVDHTYQDGLAQKLADIVHVARASARSARLKVATFEAPAAWSRNDRVGGARFDDATAFALDDDQGARIATVLNWAAHPETLWEDNPYLSPDYPGHFRSQVRASVGGEALFFSGPLGAMLTPNLERGQPFAERVSFIEKLGSELAGLTVAQLAKAERASTERLTHRWQSVSLPNRNWRFTLMRWLGLVDLDWRGGVVSCEAHHVRVGPLTILTVPGEPAPEVARQLLAALPEGPRALFALAVDEIGYVLTPEQFVNPLYHYERSVCLGAGTAALLQSATTALREEPNR